MHPRHLLATLLILCWPAQGHAWRESIPVEHRHGYEPSWHREPAGPSVPPLHARTRELVKTPGDPDWRVCDNSDSGADAAVAACGKIIARKHPANLPAAYIRRGQAWLNKGDYPKSAADFSDAIRLKPGVPGYFAQRGAVLEKSGDMDAALRDYREAARLDAGNQDALNNIKRIETRGVIVANAPSGPSAASPAAPTTPPHAALSTVPPAATKTIPPAALAVPATAAAAAAVIASAPATIAPPAQGARVALVIGNGAYANANVLPNPPNDSKAMAKALRTIGFDVVEGANLDRTAMENDVRDFLHKAANASVVLLFYAGHGMQVDGKNYLVPVDAKLAAASDLAFETIDVDKILDALSEPGHTNIILLDACRDNPLARSFASRLPPTRSAAVSAGLAAYSSIGTGTLIAYATAPGQTAQDGAGGNSPFTASLLHNIATPGLEIRQVLTRVRAEVASQTSNRQIPWDNSSLMGDVFLVR